MRGDDMWESGWQTPHSPTSTQGVGRQAHRGRTLAIGIGAILTASMLLTLCLFSAILPALTHALAPSSIPPAGTGGAQAETATPTSADWYTFTSGGGFRIDVPGVLVSSHGYFINDGSGQGADFSYQGVALSTPLQQLEVQIDVRILYSTKITTLNICPQGGTRIQLGPPGQRVPAWERDEGSAVVVNLVLNGTAIEIRLLSRDSSQPALPRYAAIWRHILASFRPLPGLPRGTTQPCG